ncbi:MAG: nitroreductase family protein [Deltaproteobacteria bacterium]|nr:nitroreductase family protein [Deltaproteobacteria bacterium]
MIEELVKGNRSYRRFHQGEAISPETLRGLVNLARLSASAANLQPLKYLLACEAEPNAAIFSCLAWAGYLKDWPGPAEGERPAAYIIILGDTEISKNFGCDHGIAAQSILLGAREQGLGGCMLGSIQRDRLRDLLKIPATLDILLVIALGRPRETVIVEEVGPGGSIKYWRDDQGVHHVPKRRLEDIILS